MNTLASKSGDGRIHSPKSESMAVLVEHLGKRFGRTIALDDVCFSVKGSESVLLAGPNGSGKSTLLKILTGVVKHPSNAKVEVLGQDPWKSRASLFARAAASFEDVAFPDFMTAREYLKFTSSSRKVNVAEATGYAGSLFGIRSFLDEQIRTYSSGMKRKVALAQALAFRSDLLILDEPFVALDAKTIKELVDELTVRKQAGTTLIISSHVITGLDDLVDRVMVMSNGRLVFDMIKSGSNQSLSQMFDSAMKNA
jgi:Cu-processing system ATP-binding protein